MLVTQASACSDECTRVQLNSPSYLRARTGRSLEGPASLRALVFSNRAEPALLQRARDVLPEVDATSERRRGVDLHPLHRGPGILEALDGVVHRGDAAPYRDALRRTIQDLAGPCGQTLNC